MLNSWFWFGRSIVVDLDHSDSITDRLRGPQKRIKKRLNDVGYYQETSTRAHLPIGRDGRHDTNYSTQILMKTKMLR